MISFSIEHDKERGTRQKIDEPPTPFRYYTYDGSYTIMAKGSFKDSDFHKIT